MDGCGGDDLQYTPGHPLQSVVVSVATICGYAAKCFATYPAQGIYARQ